MTSAAQTVTNTTKCALVDHIAQTVNQDGDIVKRVYVLVGGTSSFVDIDNDKFIKAPINKGDIIRFQKDVNNIMTAYEKVFDFAGGDISAQIKVYDSNKPENNGKESIYCYTSSGTGYDSRLFNDYGIIYTKVIAKSVGENLLLVELDAGTSGIRQYSIRLRGVPLYLYDEKAGKAVSITVNDVIDEKTAGVGNGMRAIVNLRYGGTQGVIFYNDGAIADNLDDRD